MANSGRIQFGIDLNVNQQGIQQLLRSLKDIQTAASKAKMTNSLDKSLRDAAQEAEKLEKILNLAWNNKLNKLDLSKVNNSIKQTYGSYNKLKLALESKGLGNEFNRLQNAILGTNLQLKESNKLLDKMAITMANTVRYGIASSIFNRVTSEIQKAYSYSINLNTSLNDIRIVSNKSADDMERFAVSANKAAKALGASTLDYTKASTIYYQQGLSDEETAARTETTLKAANVTGQTGQEVSEQLTAIWNGYKVTAQETELYIDKVSKVAADSAADLEELATGMSKVASAAKSAGVDIDQLNATLATVISVTREAPETIGTAFKTIYARLGDLALDGQDEYGVTLGNVSSKLHSLGIEILDESGNMRDMGEIVEETAAKWDTWTQGQRQAAAVAMAGKMQYSRLIALFDNWDMYTKYINDSQTALGSLQEQQDIYMESTAAHLQQLSTEAEKTYNILFDQDTIINFTDALNGALVVFNSFLSGLGGGMNTISALGVLTTNVFGKQLGKGISNLISTRQGTAINQDILDSNKALLNQQLNSTNKNDKGATEAYTQSLETSEQIYNLTKNISSEEFNRLNTLREQVLQQQLYVNELDKQNKKGIAAAELTTELKLQQAIIKDSTSSRQEILQIIEQINREYKKLNYESQKHVQQNEAIADSSVQIHYLLEDFLAYDTQSVITKKEQENILNRLLTIDGKRNDDQETFVDIQNIMTRILDSNLSKEKEITRELELQKVLESNKNQGLALEQIKLKELKAQQKQATDSAQREKDLSNAINSLTTIIFTAQTISGILKTVNDDSLTIEDKATSVISVLTSVVSMIAFNFKSLKEFFPWLMAQIKGLGLSLGWISLIIVGAIGAFSIWVDVINKLIKIHNQDAIAARDAAAAYKEATTAMQEATEAANELKETISDYKDGIKELENLTKGTDEYKEKLEEVNEKAKELIETYKLYDQYSIDELGYINIPQTILGDIKAKSDQKATSAKQYANYSKIISSEATLQSNKTNFTRKLDNNFDFKYVKRQTATGDIYNKRASLSQEDLEKIINAISNNQNASMKLQAGDSIKDFISNIDGLSDETLALIDNIDKESKSLKELVDATIEAADANKYYIEQINLDSVKTKYKEQIDALAYNSTTGKVDEGKSEQIATILNKMQPQQYAQQFKENSLKRLTDSDFSKAANWEMDIKNISTVLEEQLRGAFNISQDKIGNISDEETLAKEYAKYIKEVENINNLVYDKSKKQLQDLEGNVVVDVSSKENQAKAASAIYNKAYTETETQRIDDNVENLQNKYNQIFTNFLNQADEQGKELGIKWSDGIIASLASNDGTFDFSSVFPEITPQQIDAIKEKMGGQFDVNTFKELINLDDLEINALGEELIAKLFYGMDKGITESKFDLDKAIQSAMSTKESELEAIGDDLSKKKFEELKEDATEYAKTLAEVADKSDDVADSVKNNAKVATDLSLQIIKMNKAIDTLADNWKDWSSILKKSSKTSEEYSKAIRGTKEALSDLLDIDASVLSDSFMESAKNLELIGKAANGNENAIDQLRNNALEDIVLNTKINTDEIDNNTLLNKIQSIQDAINANGPISMGTEIDLNGIQIGEDKLVDYLNNMIEAAGLTQEEVNNILSGMGYEPTYETQYVEQTQSNPVIETTTTTQPTRSTPLEYTGMDGEKHRMDVPGFIQTQSSKTIGYTNEKSLVPVTAISGKGTPKISGLTKKATGSANNYSSSNKGGKSPGSSGGSSKQASKEKKLDKEKDPYHDINIELKKVSNSLDSVQTQQSKFFGAKLINNLNKQYELLQKQIDLTKEKIVIARREQEKLANTLSAQGVQFNTDGTIANYESLYQSKLDYVNNMIEKYNAMSGEEQESYKDTLEQAKEDFDKFVEKLNEYDTVITDTIPQLEKEIQDAIDKEIEINISKFNMEIEIRLNMAEAERDWNEFKKTVIDGIKDDDILGNAKAKLLDFNSYYKETEEGVIQRNTAHVNDLINQLKQIDETGTSSAYGDNKQQALDDLKTYYTQLTQDLTNIMTLQDDIHKSYISMMDEANEKFTSQVSIYEYIKDTLDHDIKLIQLLNGEDSYSELSQYYSLQTDNYNKQLEFQRQQKDFWKNAMDAAEENSEEWEKAKENWINATKEWQSAVESAVENVKNKYTNAISDIFKQLNNKVTGGLGLSYVNEQWSLINKKSEQYLDTVNAIYGVQQLENKYLDVIDNTDSLSGQKKLNALMSEEIDALQQKDKLTQYDLDRANLRYQIALKQIALEEAQQNKSSLRLRRDSQGNYSYQFVSDNDEIAKMKEEISDLYNQLYNLDLGKYKDNLDQAYSLWEEFQEKMAEAAQINDPEEREQRELLLRQEYGELINGLVEQNEEIRNNLYESTFLELENFYNNDTEAFNNTLGSKFETLTDVLEQSTNNFFEFTDKSWTAFQDMDANITEAIMSELVPGWNSGVQSMIEKFSGPDGFEETVKESMNQIIAKTDEYNNDLDKLQEAAGVDFENIQNGIDNTIDETQQLLQKNDELINNYYKQLDAIRSVINELDSLVNKYNDARNAAIAASEAAYKYWQEENERAAQAAQEEANNAYNNNNNNSNDSNNNGGGSDNNGGSSYFGDGVLSVGDTATYTGSYYYDSYGTKPVGSRYSGQEGGVVVDILNNNPYGVHIHSSDGKYKDLGWIKRDQLTGYDTGGYTGSWNSSGRLALLHEKELVLNKDDTKNFLNAINILRSITDNVNLSLLNNITNFRTLGSNLNSVNSIPNNFEQQVKIDASFPNVTKSYEIEQAFDNLMNIASQKIYKQ